MIKDSGSTNTFVLPSADAGSDDSFGYTMQNGHLSTMGGYVHTTLTDNNAVISIFDATSTGSGTTISISQGTGAASLATLRAHGTTRR